MTPTQIREWRDRMGWTQDQLAEALGVFPLTVSKWERGVQPPQPYLRLALERLAQKRRKR